MINVNKELCIGCGACAALCPNTFAITGEGKSEPMSQDDPACAKNAAESCPVQAITIS
jgi:ferredoxin